MDSRLVVFSDEFSVDGQWSEWTQWSGCDVPCGGGLMVRNRTCSNPPPKNGGRDCEGMSRQTQTCNTQTCGPNTNTQSGERRYTSHIHMLHGGLKSLHDCCMKLYFAIVQQSLFWNLDSFCRLLFVVYCMLLLNEFVCCRLHRRNDPGGGVGLFGWKNRAMSRDLLWPPFREELHLKLHYGYNLTSFLRLLIDENNLLKLINFFVVVRF